LVFAGSAARGSAITSPVEGQFSYLTSTDKIEYYDGTQWTVLQTTPSTPIATGGNGTVTSSGYTYHTFTSSGDFVVTDDGLVDVLIVSGGGGGGGGGRTGGGGGGGAPIVHTGVYVAVGTVSVVVGAGGTGGGLVYPSASWPTGAVGNSSSFGFIKVPGGGGGGGNEMRGVVGACGGGSGAGDSGVGSIDNWLPGYSGFRGGAGGDQDPSGPGCGGGGAGYGQNGADGGAAGSLTGVGGNGVTRTPWTTATGQGVADYFCGGGGGGGNGIVAGGLGGGGRGGNAANPAAAGTANSGGGGGGTINGTPANGGSGLVIVRYAV
jgi:hypothetical protein